VCGCHIKSTEDLLCACRLYDLPSSELMKHWDKTYNFIKEAK